MRPILIELFGSPIYSYPLFMGIGWGIGFNVIAGLWKKEGLPQRALVTFALVTFVLGWVGAKVFFLLFSTPDKVFHYGREINFWLGGGFVFYGGFVFSLLFALLFFHFHKSLKWQDMGLLTPGVAIGHAVGRVGCFLAGCCYGSVCELPFAVHLHGVHRHPVQLYEAAGLMALYFGLMHLWKKRYSGLILMASYLSFYSILRFSLEFFRGDKIRGLYYGLSTSQWVSLGLCLLGFFFIGRAKKNQASADF